MKFRFAVSNNRDGFRKKTEVTYCAFNTEEVSGWLLKTLEHDFNGLELWFKGVSDSLLIREEDVGSPTFQAILNFLGSEFPELDSLKLPAPPIDFVDR